MNATATPTPTQSTAIDPADHVKLVTWIVTDFIRRYPHEQRHRDDVFGEAYLALCEAAKRFDPTHDSKAKFATYARSYIWGRLQTAEQSRGTVNATGWFRKMGHVQPEISSIHKRGNIGVRMEIDQTLARDNGQEQADMCMDVRQALDELTEKERIVVELMLDNDERQFLIASALGISRALVWQRLESAKRKLAKSIAVYGEAA